MRHLLHLQTSLFADQGVSSQLGKELLAGITASKAAPWQVTLKDFSQDPVPHVDGVWLQAWSTAEAQRSLQQRQQAAYSDQLIDELKMADMLVINAPMYNFSIPSMLKAWIDHVARAGITFKYTDKGALGLLTGKKVIVIATMGGRHQPGQTDHLRPYLKTILDFLGMVDVEIIVADGLNMGAEPRQSGLAQARRQIQAVVAKLATETEHRSAA